MTKAAHTLGNGEMISDTVEELSITLTGINILDTSPTARQKDSESTNGSMGKSMKESGKTESRKAKVHGKTQRATSI